MEEVEYSGFWKRVGAFLIDNVILYIPASLFIWSAPYLEIAGTALEIIHFIYLVILWGLYYGYTESSKHQATFGKRMLKIKVINYEGEKMTFNRAVGRFLAQFISLIPLGLGFFMIAWSERKQGLHDIIAKCLVVNSK